MKVQLSHGRGAQPLYVQLAGAMQEFIASEGLRPGDLLPSENALATENELSRATIIKAFDMLAEQGVVMRRQGKGTFVAARPMERELPEFNSFSDHVQGLGLTPGSTLLSFEVFESGDPERPSSAFDDRDQRLVRLVRLRTVGSERVGIHRTLLPADIADRIDLTPVTAAAAEFSLYGALERAGIELAAGDESLRAVNADPIDAELLGVEEGTALIEVVRLSRDGEGRLIEVAQARYLGSQYVYHISFAPKLSGRGQHEATRTGYRTGGSIAAAHSLLGSH